MLELLIVILLVLWLLGAFGRGRARGGSIVHVLLVIVLILVVFRLLG